MTPRRERVVSVRLTDAEYERLCAEGKPSEVIRSRLRRPVVPAVMLPIATSPLVPGYSLTYPSRSVVLWGDGTVGNQWPATATC